MPGTTITDGEWTSIKEINNYRFTDASIWTSIFTGVTFSVANAIPAELAEAQKLVLEDMLKNAYDA